ncbi:MAG TPA: cardiolipin synthase [Pirellulaceae bacterium]|nr:cardiolipin synthase [Pirellulaceae bacterium]
MLHIFSTVWPYLFGLAHFLVMIFAAAHVVLTKRDNRAAIGWAGIIVLTPFLGALLYFMFGINRLHRRARRLLRTQAKGKGSRGLAHCSPDAVQRALGPERSHMAPLAEFVGRVTGLPLLDGNAITPLPSGDGAYREMTLAIEHAKKTVTLATYIFDNDAAGAMFVDVLASAVARGVEVRVLMDDVGTRYTWPSIKGKLREASIPFATFLPTLIPWKLNYSNLRSHRKILVVDGSLGYTGGMNIRQGTMESNCGQHPLCDLHFRVEGPVVAHLQETFLLDWEFCTGEKLEGEAWFPSLTPQGNVLARGIADGPDLDFDKIRLTIHGAIDCAHRSIHIVTPYFLPDQTLILALTVAAMRGVDVNIFIPEQNNLKLVQWACMAQLWQVLQRGCKVWLTPPPFDHSKIMLVDDVWSMIGSGNWDPRSLRLNFEFNVECYDRELAARLRDLVELKRQRSKKITLADVDGRPLLIRLRDGVARLATPYL